MIIKAYKYCGLIVKPANCPPLVLNQLMKLKVHIEILHSIHTAFYPGTAWYGLQ